MNRAHLAPLAMMGLLAACGGGQAERRPQEPAPRIAPPPRGPAQLALVEQPLLFQDEQEPWRTEASFEFELPRRPRRARLVLRYSGVPGATSQDYTMGRFRHRVELNGAFLMDLNTFARDEQEVVEYTKWISPGMLRARNKLVFTAGDDGNREGRPKRDEFELRLARLEFDW